MRLCSSKVEYTTALHLKVTNHEVEFQVMSKRIVQPWSVRALPGNQVLCYVISEGHPLFQWVIRIGSQWAVQVFQTCNVPMVHETSVKNLLPVCVSYRLTWSDTQASYSGLHAFVHSRTHSSWKLRAKIRTVKNVRTNSYPFSIFMAYAFIGEIFRVWIPSPYQHLGRGKGRKRKKEKQRVYEGLRTRVV